MSILSEQLIGSTNTGKSWAHQPFGDARKNEANYAGFGGYRQRLILHLNKIELVLSPAPTRLQVTVSNMELSVEECLTMQQLF